jgi:hypothetical protein
MKQLQLNNGKRLITEDIKPAIKKEVNFKRLIKVIYKLALGKGKPHINSNTGLQVTDPPNLDAAKLLFQYAYGQPGQQDALSNDAREALESFAAFAKKNVKSISTPKATKMSGDKNVPVECDTVTADVTAVN